MRDVVIRSVTPTDLPALFEVEVSASSRYRDAEFSLADAPPRHEQDLHRLADETPMLVAEINGPIAGCDSVVPLGPFLHLEGLAVSRA